MIFVILTILLVTLLLIFGRQLLFALTMLVGAVYVPTSDEKLKTMLMLAKPKKSDKIIDIGSGDGKVVFALAKLGFKSVGIEINPILVNGSKLQSKKLGLDKLVAFKRMNFWNADFSKYDLIFLYGTTYIMKKLEKKLMAELKPGARVVSNYFQFPNWRPEKQEKDVRLYRK